MSAFFGQNYRWSLIWLRLLKGDLEEAMKAAVGGHFEPMGLEQKKFLTGLG